MKRLLFILFFIPFMHINAQMVATVELKEPIEGMCDPEHLYALMPFFGEGQVEAVPPSTTEEMSKKVNSECEYLKNNPKFKGEGMIGFTINCNGELIKCEMDNKTTSTELDDQIIQIVKTMAAWTAGRMYDNPVDSYVIWSFSIKKGVITFN